MLVNLVSYMSPHAGMGGGELNLRDLLSEGEARGHDIRLTHRFPRPMFELHESPDVTLMADVWNIPTHWGRPDRRLLARLAPGSPCRRYRKRVAAEIGRGRFVHLDHSYVDVCSRPYLPCNGEPESPLHRGVRGRRCARLRKRTAAMYRGSLLNCFVSPLHARTVEGLLGPPLPRRLILRPFIDPGKFRDLGRERDLDRLHVGALVEAKGLENMRARYAPSDVWVLSPPWSRRRRFRRTPADPGFGRALPYRAHEEMPALYNRTRRLVHLPRWPEPLGRSVVEGALCGCSIEANDRVGALSFDLPPEDPRLCEGAAAECWDAIEGVAGTGTDRNRRSAGGL